MFTDVLKCKIEKGDRHSLLQCIQEIYFWFENEIDPQFSCIFLTTSPFSNTFTCSNQETLGKAFEKR